LDKGTLPDPVELGAGQSQEYEAARTKLEAQLIVIWEKVLGRKSISINDNFFELGGHSLKAAKFSFMSARELNLEISLKDIFTYPTVKSIAQIIEEGKILKDLLIPVADDLPYYPLSPAQNQLWIADQLENPDSTIFNIFGSFLFKGDLDVEALEKAFETVISRHEILRTAFITVAGVPVQKVLSTAEIKYHLDFLDLRDISNAHDKVIALSEKAVTKRFDLTTGGLVRTELIQLASDEFIFLLTLHHIIADGWSIDVLLSEISLLYRSYSDNTLTSLPKLPLQYKDFSTWQNNLVSNDAMEIHRVYWKEQFSGDLPLLNLPTDFPGATDSNAGGLMKMKVDGALGEKLRLLSVQCNTTLFVTLFSAVNLLLYRYTGQRDIITAFPSSGRTNKELERLIGFFINIIPIRTRINPENSFERFLLSVKDNIMMAFKHEAFPVMYLEDINLMRPDIQRTLFNVLIQVDYSASSEGTSTPFKKVAVDNYDVRRNTSKYDLTFFFFIDAMTSEILFTLEYKSNLFKEETIKTIQADLLRLLSAVADNPGLILSDKELISSESEEIEWNNFTKPLD
ncbi:condensation domain-containing protein, partial [Mucilaginibacter sp. RCC_168]|uniref:condensation domain-containing protein n=1 Tax=Mucilaginibacter sp. RCC_168 TaxID=3239221 RepID=UPI003524AB0A